jgi:hypothetical protein
MARRPTCGCPFRELFLEDGSFEVLERIQEADLDMRRFDAYNLMTNQRGNRNQVFSLSLS